jgi:hypothetical protein
MCREIWAAQLLKKMEFGSCTWNLNVLSVDFSSLSEQEQQAFWKSRAEEGGKDGRFVYGEIRSLLVKQLISRKIAEHSSEVYLHARPLKYLGAEQVERRQEQVKRAKSPE